ncbi:ribonuclease HII [Chitinivorax tropicus]|uniref:Ribonuclease HII n=1 Tax=Chitinivorax tropicus TaxID=714531 RepID=A0A840MK36_9PROT|nr:ribonuclease HII [Chitinivorax tropicus]MBB5019554.1 ribonuclease HII [Chitinivorax tropicus]
MLICGVDEAGRGPLAGAVYAAAVILGPDHGIVGLADSKKLTEAKRDALAIQIKSQALAWAIAKADVAEIDQLNILQATMLAMQRAVMQVAANVTPDEVQVDGNRTPKLSWPARAIIKGDALVAEISAASILAKTARDAECLALHASYPQYGFDQHKGYPTPAHMAALQLHGASPVHRRSYAPVKAVLGQAQGSLF